LFDSTGTPLPSTTFDATAKNVVINSGANFGGYTNFAISVEPKGGSPAPTGPIAMIANS
jgi:anti-sigma-K factor RskA